jgi:polyhydroxyalkanoate synthase
MPDALPMHLMLAMMQSGILPNASMPWSNSFLAFMPDWMRPKTPLEQANEQLQSLWQSASEPFQQLSEQWLNANPWLNQNAPLNDARSEASSRARPGISSNALYNKKEEHTPKMWWEIPGQARDDGLTPPSPSLNDFFTDFFNPQFLQSLSSEAVNHSTGFLQGMQAYLASDYERPTKEYDVLWERGSARLLDLAPDATDAVAVLCVPSLINKSTILDLYPEVSFVEFLASRGFRPLILDWGSPNEDECEFAMADYISFYALDALAALRAAHDGPIALMGYCMGGIFTTAMAQLAARHVDAMVLLATPWDFSSKDTPVVLLAPSTQLTLRNWINTQYPVQPLVTQTVFHLIDPWRVQEKFSRYPFLSDAEKTHFLAVEQWVNDGVPLANKVAEECFVDWPQGNILAKHQWKVGRRWIEPELIACPTLAVIPTRDAIVPKGCATPLTKLLKRCDVIYPECGHVSMVVGKNARRMMWEPVAEWLEEKF